LTKALQDYLILLFALFRDFDATCSVPPKTPVMNGKAKKDSRVFEKDSLAQLKDVSAKKRWCVIL